MTPDSIKSQGDSHIVVPAIDPTVRSSKEVEGDLAKKIDDIASLVRFGFIVLLIMVATLVIGAFYDYKHSVDQLRNDQYQFLKERIEFFQRT